MADTSWDDIEVEQGPHPPGEIVTVARNRIKNTGSLGTVRMQFAELDDAANSVLTMICDSSLEMGFGDEAVLSNHPGDPDQCTLTFSSDLGTLSAQMTPAGQAEQVFGIRFWAPEDETIPGWIEPTSGSFISSHQATWRTTTLSVFDPSRVEAVGCSGLVTPVAPEAPTSTSVLVQNPNESATLADVGVFLDGSRVGIDTVLVPGANGEPGVESLRVFFDAPDIPSGSSREEFTITAEVLQATEASEPSFFSRVRSAVGL